MRVFGFIVYFMYVENQAKKRKMLQLDAKILPFFDFDEDLVTCEGFYEINNSTLPPWALFRSE
jgi:hypothetical protein